jgi:putative MATE family efflux protein
VVWRSEYDGEILRLAVPAFGALVSEPLYVLADTAIVGHLGTPQLGGVAVASSAVLTVYVVFIFLAYGTTAAVARLIGAGDKREAARQAVQGMWLALVISLPLVAAGVVYAGVVVRGLGASGAVATNAEVYLRISVLGLPALLVTLAGTGYLRGRQDTRTPLAVAVGSNVFNLIVELALINGLGFGVGASALTTVLAQYAAAAVYVAVVANDAARSHGVPLGPDWSSIGALGRVGGAFVIRAIALRGSFTLATAVAAHIGGVDVAAHAIAYGVWSFLSLALDAVAIAGQAMVGKALGAGDDGAARSMSRRMIELGVPTGMAFGLLVIALRTVLPHLFSNDHAVVALASFLLWYVAATQPLTGVVSVLDGVLIGAGDIGYLASASLAAGAVLIAGAAAVLANGLGVGWLWAAISAFMAARLAGLYPRYRAGRWAIPGAVR